MAEQIGVRNKKGEAVLIALGTLFVLAVGSVTGLQSWGHIVHVGESVGEPSAPVLPVSIDGMMLAGTVLGAVDRMRGMKMRGWAVAGLWVGAALTLAFNTLSAVGRGIGAMFIAVLCAVAFLISVEMVFHPSRTPLDAIKKIKETKQQQATSPEPTSVKPDAGHQQHVKQGPSTPGQPPRRPDRKGGKPSWESRKPNQPNGGRPNNGQPGKGTPQPRQEPKPVTVSVSATPREEARPVAMDEKLSDLVDTAVGDNA